MSLPDDMFLPKDMLPDNGEDDIDYERQEEFEEDGPCDVMVLVVLDDMPRDVGNTHKQSDPNPQLIILQALNRILQDNYGARLWLADTYDNLPNNTDEALSGYGSVEADWRSSFIGQTVEDAIAWIRAIPKPGKVTTRTFCAVIKRELFEKSGDVLICKTPNEAVGRTEIETIPCSASAIGTFYHGFPRDAWALQYGDQMLY